MTSPLIRNQQETIKAKNQTSKNGARRTETTSKSPTLKSMRNHDQSQQEKKQDQWFQKAEQERDHQ